MKLALTLFAALMFIGCGGRVHVEDGFGAEVRTVFQTQVQQRKNPGMLSAADANAVISSHRKVMGGKKSGSGGGGGTMALFGNADAAQGALFGEQ